MEWNNSSCIRSAWKLKLIDDSYPCLHMLSFNIIRTIISSALSYYDAVSNPHRSPFTKGGYMAPLSQRRRHMAPLSHRGNTWPPPLRKGDWGGFLQRLHVWIMHANQSDQVELVSIRILRVRNYSISVRKAGIFYTGWEIKVLRGGVHRCAAQTTPADWRRQCEKASFPDGN